VQNQIVPAHSSYETAPIQVSNGVIRTIASSIKGGKLADDQTAYIPTIRDRHNTMAPPSIDDGGTEEHLPLKFDWDSALLLALLLSVYACFVARKQEIQ
jgi:hypothetical protein